MAGLEKLERARKQFTREQFVQLSDAVAKAVRASAFKRSQFILADPSDGKLTQSERDHRIDLCLEWAFLRRFDDKWSIDRICDNMERFLRDKLDTKDTTPNERGFWATES